MSRNIIFHIPFGISLISANYHSCLTSSPDFEVTAANDFHYVLISILSKYCFSILES